MRKRNFTLIEVLFVITILIILIGIGWIAGNKVLRAQNEAKTRAEIAIIEVAIIQYRERYNSLPFNDTQLIDFAEKLSPVPVGKGWNDTRPMFVDYTANNIYTNNDEYDSKEASETTILDPYENPYQVVVTLNTAGDVESFNVETTTTWD